MAWVDELRIGNAILAIIPVWAIKTLMTDTIDVLVTAVADSLVRDIAARIKKSLRKRLQNGLCNSWCECMLWIVTMLGLLMAWNAEIEVLTVDAGNEVGLRVFLNARVASSREGISSNLLWLVNLNKSGLRLVRWN
jgi:hypothetical protein